MLTAYLQGKALARVLDALRDPREAKMRSSSICRGQSVAFAAVRVGAGSGVRLRQLAAPARCGRLAPDVGGAVYFQPLFVARAPHQQSAPPSSCSIAIGFTTTPTMPPFDNRYVAGLPSAARLRDLASSTCLRGAFALGFARTR